MPWEFLESAAGRLACMRSPTMFWTKAGIVLGNEGNNCCPLNCTHVYGYTTLLERLYPDLAKDMRVSDFVRNYDPVNGVAMRYGTGGYPIDGSLACVIKAYLVVQQADANTKWLPTVWPNIKASIDLIFKNFDTAGDGMFRCEQHNTYDTAMQGPNTFIGSYWVTGLKATAAMATLMGDTDYATKCTTRAALSAANYEKTCWNEKFGYYIADVTEATSAHSYGPGCFIDQLCAIGLSTACGFGTMFDPAHEAAARKQILKYNKVTKPPFQDMQKHFYDGDSGITVCTYPNGKLGNGMQYTTLVSIGFTYPVVAGMIYEGNIEDASTIAKYIRARHSGINRSPWNEPECGLLYSRAMASWNLFDQSCGFEYDSTKSAIGYAPKTNATAFQAFITVQDGWGQFKQSGTAGLASGSASLEAIQGTIVVETLKLVSSATRVVAACGGKNVPATIAAGVITFSGGRFTIPTGSVLAITLSSADVTVSIDGGAKLCCPGGNCGPAVTTNGLRQRRKEEEASTDVVKSGAMVAVNGATDAFQKFRLIVTGLLLFFLGLASGKILEYWQTQSDPININSTSADEAL
jgi:hypothetical protein